MSLLDTSHVSTVDILQAVGADQKVGTPTSVKVINVDGDNNVILAKGTTVPTNGDAGFAKGCLFIKTNGGLATTLYLNEGTATVADFNAVESSASTITGVTVGDGLIGGGLNGTVNIERGITVQNDSGGNLVPGDLVYLVSASAIGAVKALKATANGKMATHVVTQTILNGDRGVVYEYWLSDAVFNTNAGNVGDPVYLAEAGFGTGWTLTAPGANGASATQAIGAIVTKDAAAGVIHFFPSANVVYTYGTTQMNPALNTRAIVAPLSQLPALTGADQVGIIRFLAYIPGPATIVSARLVSSVTTAGSDATNNYQFTLRNLSDGTDLMSAAYNTNGAELNAEFPTVLNVDQNQIMTSAKNLGLWVTIKDDAGAGPTDLSTASLRVEIIYTPNS